MLSKDVQEKSEAKLASGQEDCVLPPIYERAFKAKPTVADKLAFQAERIGDYSIANCF